MNKLKNVILKILKFVFLTIWTLCCLSGILDNYSHYGLLDWVIILIFTATPYIIIWFIVHKSKKSNYRLLNNYDHAGKGPQVSSTNRSIDHTDGQHISGGEIPYLIQPGYEHALQEERNSKNPKFHRSLHEEDLSFDFATKYENQVIIYTDKFETLYNNAQFTNNLDQKISLLKQAVKAFKKAKKFCYSKGKGGKIYFQDMWEYLHNSQKDCYSYLDLIQNSLNEAIFLKKNMIPRIINTIKTHDGILQKDIYYLLPDINRQTIQNILKKLDTNHTIIRVKKGNSYELHLFR